MHNSIDIGFRGDPLLPDNRAYMGSRNHCQLQPQASDKMPSSPAKSPGLAVLLLGYSSRPWVQR